MNYTKFLSCLLIVLGALGFVECKKSTESPFSDTYQNMMRENALMQAAFDDVLKVIENVLMNNNQAKIGTLGAPLDCYTSIDSVVTGANTTTYTITFSKTCTGYDGKVRRGKIICELTGASFNATGAKAVITLEDYSIDYNVLIGKMKFENKGNGLQHVQISDVSGTSYAQMYILQRFVFTYWKANYNRRITSGDGDNNLINNKYLIGGVNGYAFEGITSDNKHYTGYPKVPLLLSYGCPGSQALRYPVYGRIEFVLENSNYRSVDYGDSTVCNKAVSLIFNDTQESYYLY